MKIHHFFIWPIIFIFCCKDTSAQKDSSAFKKRFTLSTDIVLDLLNEKNVSLEVKTSQRFAFGASYGWIKPFEMNEDIFSRDMFIANHDQDPGRVYSGNSFRLNTKYYLSKKYNFYYIQVGLMYKSLHYDTAFFHDGARASDTRSFSRSNEKANLLGTDLITGLELVIGKLFVIDCFTGIGYRFKDRNYTTYYSTGGYGSQYPKVPLGDFNINHNYISFTLGLRMGFCYTKK